MCRLPHLQMDWNMMEKSQELLLQRLSRVLFGNPDSSPLPDDVFAEARIQAVSSLVANDYQVIAKNIRLISAHAELTKLLEGIPFTSFKGYASAFYYPVPEKRVMGDVDFIVDPEYYQKAVDRLFHAGLERQKQHNPIHEIYKKMGITYELHSEINGIPDGINGTKTENMPAGIKIRKMLEDLIDTSVKVETQQGPIIIPDEFHHGLIMLLHITEHMVNAEGVGLRHLCDWAVYAHRVDLELFRDRLEELGLWTFACQLTAVSSAYLGLPKKHWAGEWPEQFLEGLIEDFLNAGNFGRQNDGRAYSLILAKDSYAELIRTEFPFSRKYPVLLPCAMMIYPFRYIMKVITGEKKLVKLSTIKDAKKRNRIYDQFQLFKTK